MNGLYYIGSQASISNKPFSQAVPGHKKSLSCSYSHNWRVFRVQVKPLLSACQRMACAALGGRPIKMVGSFPKQHQVGDSPLAAVPK